MPLRNNKEHLEPQVSIACKSSLKIGEAADKTILCAGMVFITDLLSKQAILTSKKSELSLISDKVCAQLDSKFFQERLNFSVGNEPILTLRFLDEILKI